MKAQPISYAHDCDGRRLYAWTDGSITVGRLGVVLASCAVYSYDMTPAMQAIELRDLLTLAAPGEVSAVAAAFKAELASARCGVSASSRARNVWRRVSGMSPHHYKAVTTWKPRRR